MNKSNYFAAKIVKFFTKRAFFHKKDTAIVSLEKVVSGRRGSTGRPQ